MLGLVPLTGTSNWGMDGAVSGAREEGEAVAVSAQCGDVFVFKGHPVALFNGTQP